MTPDILMKTHPINKKTLFTLWVLCLIGFIAVIPYSLRLTGLEYTPAELLTTNSLISLLQNILLYGLLILTGMYIARRIGLEIPILSGIFNKEDVAARVTAMLIPAVLIGLIGGGVVLLLDHLVFGPPLETELLLLGVNLPETIHPPVWQGLLASLYGAINEEVLLRLFMLTLIAGLMAAILRRLDQKLPAGIFWVANILAAILFGLGHLPATAAIGLPIDFLVVTRAIVLNGLLGIGFGWLYWKHGLESAMLGHFSADIVLHVLMPLAMTLLPSA